MSNGQHASSSQPASRPEWMLAPPPSASISDMLRSDPRAALKSRGFSQSASQRIQQSGTSAGSGRKANEATLWTESPVERAERLRDEELGVRKRATLDDGSEANASTVSNDAADRQREERIKAAVEQHMQSRGPSLLEQHQEKRRGELRRREADSFPDGEDDERRRRRRREKERRRESGDDGEAGRRKRRHEGGHRHHSVSPPGSDRSDKDTRRRGGRSRPEGEIVDKRGDRHKEDRHRRRHTRSRSRSPSRSETREERERRREKERKKRRREEEERGEKKGAPMMVWDREAALSVGGRLMDERKRMDVIKGAASLNDRFGSGSSRYM